jgi:hypothetical protein
MPLPADKIGISLSGGGYRATAFHPGTLKKFNERGDFLTALTRMQMDCLIKQAMG